jgi:hypothetical protein
VRRFLWAFLGATVAMAAQVFITYRTELIFNADRWGDTISIGLTFGMFMAILVLLVSEIPSRLRGFWPWWMRLIFSAVIGFFWGAFTWGAFTWFFLTYPPNWDVMAFAGAFTALGFIIADQLKLPGWASALVTAVCTYFPIYVLYDFFWNGRLAIPLPFSPEVMGNPPALLYYDYPEQIFTLAIPVVLLIALGAYAPALWRDALALVQALRLRGQKTAAN